MLAEEDVISEAQVYTCSALCTSLEATLYVITKEEFFTLKNSADGWLTVLEKALWKEKRNIADHIGEKIQKEKEIEKEKR